jgi:DNA-binding Lrp family transcriptional regulator
MDLDRADLKLLDLLQQDGRTTIQALSEAIHLSARATLNRVRKLEAEGLIEGYRALLSRAVLGEQICVIAEIALKEQRQSAVQRFEKKMASTAEVVACYVVSGRYDYIVRIACPNLDHYHRLINGWLEDGTLGVEKIVTNIELQTIKEFAGFPVPRQ